MKKLVKPIYLFAKNLIVDPYINANGTPHIPFLEQLKLSWNYRLGTSKNAKKLKLLKDKHKGQRCFIIGNGPSLNKTDLTLLKNEVTFGVNAIYTNFDNMGFNPTYYVVEDIFVAEDRASEINKFHGPTKFFGNYLRYCIEPDANTLWLNVQFRYEDRAKMPNFSGDASRKVWTGGTVTYLSIQLAYYMGFKDVYMVGFDHNYDIPKEVKISGNDILSLGDDVNHFNKEYFGKGKRWHDPMVDRMEKAYEKANIEFAKKGSTIYNATVGGKLEVFKRVDYKTLF